MIRLVLALLYLARVVQGTATNTTSPTCPEVPGGSYRSVWSILGSCALTLVICLWHTVHPDVSKPGKESTWLKSHVMFVIGSFLAPEVVIWLASQQWIEARQMVLHFREEGYEWSMTHSYFAENGGFVYCDKEGNVEAIKAKKFLELCKAGKIVNPLITENEIKDRSKSDAVSKAIFTIQLLWFVVQVVARHSIGLEVTLVELDTLCMAVLAVFHLLIWWSKPLGVRYPHIFYESSEAKVYSREELSEAWKPQPSFHKLWHASQARSINNDIDEELEGSFPDATKAALNKAIGHTTNKDVHTVLFVAWGVLGGLHLTSWNYEFPTEKEKLLWRSATLGLTGGAPMWVIVHLIEKKNRYWVPFLVTRFTDDSPKFLTPIVMCSALVCRVMLAVLMFFSLRTLPCSAHHIISWVQYIPHL